MSFYLAAAVIAYLLGSIPFGYILVRTFRGQDIRASGSGNIGATNVARSSPWLGVATLLLDATKGYAAVAIALHVAWESATRIPSGAKVEPLMGGAPAEFAARMQASLAGLEHIYTVGAVAALFVILGHLFPIWLKLRGGKGVATSIGVFIALSPRPLIAALLVFIIIVLVSRYVSLGSIVASAMFPFLAYAMNAYHYSPPVLEVMCAIAALIIIKHRENIRRLLAGTENRFALKRTRA
jgi:acyl phosphate:glycerol-3-phosphate acyltransferase